MTEIHNSASDTLEKGKNPASPLDLAAKGDALTSPKTGKPVGRKDKIGKNVKFLNDDASLSIYLKEIGSSKNLSLSEEAELARRIHNGDRQALHKLVSANLKFVVSVCRNYQNQGLPLVDLINEGNLGLIRAAKRFDETKQFKFISYAVWWVRQAILSALAEQSRSINIPLNRVGVIHKIGRVTVRLEQKLGRPPMAAELAEALDMTENEIHESLQLGANPMSLDAPVQNDEDGCLNEILEDGNADSPDKGSMEGALRSQVMEVLGTLEDRESEVMKLYFGIGVETTYTLEEIGARFNLTRERVRQIKEKALKRLKHPSRMQRLETFQNRG